VSVTGNGAATVRLFVFGEDDAVTTRLFTARPGQQTVEIPFEVTGNTRWSLNSNLLVLAKAIHGVVIGGYTGGLTVLNDDPMPTVTITPDAGTVAEGGVLRWTATSSAVADSPLDWYSWALPPSAGPELSSTDVDPEWFRNAFGDPLPSRPLSEAPVFLAMEIPPGSLTAEITIPTVADTEAEPTEYVRLFLTSWPPVTADQELVGAVTDQ